MQWMVWTTPTALFFAAIGLILVSMTVWHQLSPSIERRGFLPLSTTRGDRLFIGLLTSAYLHLAWVGITDFPVWIMTLISVAWLIVIIRWG